MKTVLTIAVTATLLAVSSVSAAPSGPIISAPDLTFPTDFDGFMADKAKQRGAKD